MSALGGELHNAGSGTLVLVGVAWSALPHVHQDALLSDSLSFNVRLWQDLGPRFFNDLLPLLELLSIAPNDVGPCHRHIKQILSVQSP